MLAQVKPNCKNPLTDPRTPRSAMANRKTATDEDMQQEATDDVTQALEKYSTEQDSAAYIKKDLDKKYTPTGQCIVNRNFHSYVTHETKRDRP